VLTYILACAALIPTNLVNLNASACLLVNTTNFKSYDAIYGTFGWTNFVHLFSMGGVSKCKRVMRSRLRLHHV